MYICFNELELAQVIEVPSSWLQELLIIVNLFFRS